VFCKAFFYLEFGFVIFRQNNIGAKAARKMCEIDYRQQGFTTYLGRLIKIAPQNRR